MVAAVQQGIEKPAAPARGRIHSIDLLRGFVILLMALDHVRDYWSLTSFWPEDLSQTSPEYFFTRWVTHYCAPVFVFLSGTSAWLYRENRQIDRHQLARFLLTRGLWLVLVEVTVVNFSWQLGYSFIILQVIWAIGWSMVILAGLIYLPVAWIAALSLLTIAGHNLLDGIQASQFGSYEWVWLLLHEQRFFTFQDSVLSGIFFSYPLIPWFAVMALGYVCGAVFMLPQSQRNRLFVQLGLGMTAAFIVLRGFNLYGNPTPWLFDERGWVWNVIAILNTQKYPPSLSYLLMTLGPALLLIPLLEQWRGSVANVVRVFGKVPFFFYLLHLPLIHVTARIWQWLSFGELITPIVPASQWPEAYEPSLLRAYLVWFAVIFVLYWPCRWFVRVRQRYAHWWLSYL